MLNVETDLQNRVDFTGWGKCGAYLLTNNAIVRRRAVIRKACYFSEVQGCGRGKNRGSAAFTKLQGGE